MWLLFAMMMTAAGCILPSMTTGGRKGGRLLPPGQPRYDERFRGIQCVCFDADEVGARCFHESGGAPRAQSRAENY
jgi:hypothetical protein